MIEFLIIITMHDEDINALEYEDPNNPGDLLDLSRGSKTLIKILISMHTYWLQMAGGLINIEDVLLDDFAVY